MVITFSKSKDKPVKVANPARGQLNRETNISLSSFVPENLVSRDGFGSPVPRQPAHLHTQTESGAYLLRDSSQSSSYILIKSIREEDGFYTGNLMQSVFPDVLLAAHRRHTRETKKQWFVQKAR